MSPFGSNVTTIDGRNIDQVISFRYPSYAVRHPRHVCWFNHTMREYYDLWPQLVRSISWRNRIKETMRRGVLHAVDRWLLKQNVTDVVAQSRTIQRRLADDLNVTADVLYPPPPLHAYRCDGYGDYMFAISRLTPLKRVDLLVRALAEPIAGRVKAVIAGEGDSRPALEALARSLGVAERIAFLGRIDEPTMLNHLARCRAVCFTPFAEDYGLVTVEAFASGKAVVTSVDSGGPAELVHDGDNGLVSAPTPQSLAISLARLSDDAVFAERLGARAKFSAAAMTWPAAVRRLVIV